MISRACSRVSTKKSFYILRQFFSLISNHYISNILNLYNLEGNSSLASQTICDHIFYDPKSDHNFHVFQLSIWFIYIFLLYVGIIHLLQRQKCVGIYYKLIPNWIKLTQSRIFFTTKYRTKLKILLVELFRKYHIVIRQPASPYLDSLIATASLVFIPRLFPRP